jgi:TetR/AcrR family transcriptional regulator, mexJK operon transcriptional repressor
MRLTQFGRDHDRFKVELIAVARRLFINNGFDAVSMEAVGDALGVSKPKVYDAIGSKQALFEAVVEDAIVDFDLSWFHASISRGDTLSDFIDLTAAEAMDIARSEKRLALPMLVMRESERARDILIARVKGPMRAQWEELVRTAVRRGECDEIDPAVLRKLMIAPLAFVAFQQAAMGEGTGNMASTEAYIRTSYAMIKQSLLTRRLAAA